MSKNNKNKKWTAGTSALRLGSILPLLLAWPALAQADKNATPPLSAPQTARMDEIIVTATRREQSLSDVPVAVTAFSQNELTKKNLTTIDNIARETPGVSFSRAAYGTQRANTPAIRGIGSDVGGTLTGMYIDDTPLITDNSTEEIANPIYPHVYDLERVEVLKGPQGTLFGAGSMGGAIRFITPQPSLTKTSIRATTEVSTTAGDVGYEFGGAVGAPIIQDKLGFRLSAFYHRDAGYIDHRDVLTGSIDRPNTNWSHTGVINAALRWAPSDNITITPSLFYQYEYHHDTDQVWLNLSNLSADDIEQGQASRTYSEDRFYLPALKIEWDVGPATLISNTSYLWRKEHTISDIWEELNSSFLAAFPNPPLPYAQQAGDAIPIFYLDKQKSFTQELRLQSTDTSSRLQWVLGLFYFHSKQDGLIDVQRGDILNRLTERLFGATVAEVTGVAPIDLFGHTDSSYILRDAPHRTQKAVYAQADYEIFQGVKATAGIRYTVADSSFTTTSGGPFVGGPTFTVAGKTSGHSVTPKFGISYQPNKENLFYANVSKGFRPGGAQAPVPAGNCAADLRNLGFSSPPTSYDYSLWSYEVGSKNNLFGERLQVDGSAYYIRWSNIQRGVLLPICSFRFIANLGHAESKGFELALSAHPTDTLSMNVNIGYNRTESLDTLSAGTRADGTQQILVRAGQSLGNRNWVVTGGAQQSFTIRDLPAYVGVDLTYQGPETQSLDPTVQGYIALDAIQPKGYMIVKLRGSVMFDNIELTPYIDNVFNKHPILNYRNFGPLIYSATLQPRTIGMRVTYRN